MRRHTNFTQLRGRIVELREAGFVFRKSDFKFNRIIIIIILYYC